MLIVEPLSPQFSIHRLRTTEIEGEILQYKIDRGQASPMYTQDDPYLMDAIYMYGTICHDIFLPSCLDKRFGEENTKIYTNIIHGMMQEIKVKYSDKLASKKKISILDQLSYLSRVTLPRGDFITLGKQFPADYVECEIPLQIQVGDVLIHITCKIDHVSTKSGLVLSDLKSSKKKWDCEDIVYTLDTIKGTDLENKLQMIIYSLGAMYRFGYDECIFQYIPFIKHDTLKEKKFEYEVIRFKITKEEAERKLSSVMKSYVDKILLPKLGGQKE